MESNYHLQYDFIVKYTPCAKTAHQVILGKLNWNTKMGYNGRGGIKKEEKSKNFHHLNVTLAMKTMNLKIVSKFFTSFNLCCPSQ